MFLLRTLVPIFVETVLPVFLVAGAGYWLAWRMSMDGRSLGRLLFYLATPSLVFRSLYAMEVEMSALLHVAQVAAVVVVLTGLAGWLISFDQARRERVAIILTSAVSNNGNMGIPISMFAFGEMGLALGSLYYVVTSFSSNTVGVAVASAGQASIGKALLKSLQVPMLYAAFLGLLLNQTEVTLPSTIFRAVDLLANAAIPGMLILLGVQLRAAPLLQGQGVIWRSTAVRLVASPLLAIGLCALFGIEGVERNVVILQAAMPTAVMSAVLATEFDAAPQLVAAVIFVSTLVSMFTLSLVLWFLL